MVSLWPWKGQDNSPAAFEQALSTLSAKISQTQAQLDRLRQRSRRVAALWTLYTTFAYLFCAIILALVVGWRNWTILEYGAVAGSPFLIYAVRLAITTFYTYRIDTVTARLEEQQGERAKTIEKLKAATKYDSTQQLLEKYGGAAPKPVPKPKAEAGSAKGSRKLPKQTGRTSMGPPATANIPRNQPMGSAPSTPQPVDRYMGSPMQPMQIPSPSPARPMSLEEPGPPEFAPNAFGTTPQYDMSTETSSDGNWYDRILDVLLGEDETSPRNRIVLICQHCRLVNGQAPPGVKRLVDLGRWRCFGCGGWNGEVDEGTKIVEAIKDTVEKEGSDVGAVHHEPEMEERKRESLGSSSGEHLEKLTDEDSYDDVAEEPEPILEEQDEEPKARRRRPAK